MANTTPSRNKSFIGPGVIGKNEQALLDGLRHDADCHEQYTEFLRVKEKLRVTQDKCKKCRVRQMILRGGQVNGL